MAKHEPILFDDQGLYTKPVLEGVLEGVMTVETFLNRIRPPQVWKGVYRGVDLNEAIRRAPALGDERAGGQAAIATDATGRRSGARKPIASGGLTPIDIRSLKTS